MSPWLRELQEAELVGKVPPVYPLNDKSVEWGGWETRVVVAREEFWAWALSSLCVTHQRQSDESHTVTKALRLKILPGQLLPLFPNPPTLLTCHSTGKPGEPCRPAPPPAVPSTRGSSTSTSHRGRSDAHKLPTPGRPAGLTSQPNGHTTWW